MIQRCQVESTSADDWFRFRPKESQEDDRLDSVATSGNELARLKWESSNSVAFSCLFFQKLPLKKPEN